MARAFVLEMHLAGVVPRIWRRVRVPADLTLLDLHHAIQVVMSWQDYHLHVFEVGGREYGPRPEEEGERDDWAGDDGGLTIARALAESGGPLDYLYDFGDDWRLTIALVAEASVERPTIDCLDGERAAPPEDCGGPAAYQEIVDVLAADGVRGLDPAIRDWLPRGFDPSAFDLEAVNARLRRAFRQKASPDRPAGPHATDQAQLLATLTLATLLLGSRRTKQGQREASKSARLEILDALQDADLIFTDAKRKTVIITEAGIRRAQAFLDALTSSE